jgi:hypothetical protein
MSKRLIMVFCSFVYNQVVPNTAREQEVHLLGNFSIWILDVVMHIFENLTLIIPTGR